MFCATASYKLAHFTTLLYFVSILLRPFVGLALPGLRTYTHNPIGNLTLSFIHSFISAISISPLHSFTTYRRSRLQHGSCIGVSRRSTHATAGKGLAQGPYAAARAGVELTTLWLKVIVSTKVPPRPTHVIFERCYTCSCSKLRHKTHQNL